ncbi:MAG TPA: hypothetical protein VN666_04445 [Nitrospira sp.]|nr:hypothetical protein [Nitrospira sp.]
MNWFARRFFEDFLREKNKAIHNRFPKEKPDKDRVLAQYCEEFCALIENSKTQKQFITGAKKLWSKVFTLKEMANQRRPSEWRTIIVEIKRWYEARNRDFRHEMALDGQLIRDVKANHPRLNAYTIRKYVRLFRVTWTPPWERTKGDWELLNENASEIVQAELEAIRNILRERPQTDGLASLLRDVEQHLPSLIKSR